MKVLIITYSMIPYATSWGGCQRMYYLSNAFLDYGWDVTVMSVRNEFLQTFGNSVRFNSVAFPIKKKIYRAFVDSKAQKCNEIDIEKRTNSFVRILRTKIKQNKSLFKLLTSFDAYIFNEPSFLMGPITRSWCHAYSDRINNYIHEYGVNVVIISGPPFGMFCLSKEIKKKNNVPVILDYRDPWNLWHKESRFALKLEGNNFKYVDKVIFTNRNLERDMCKKFPILVGKTDVVMNGYSSDAWAKIKCAKVENHKQFIITYTGSVDIVETSKFGFRDVTVLFDALEKAVDAGCNIKLVFVGAANPNTPYAEEQKKRLGNHLEIRGMVCNIEAMEMMVQSDALLILHTTTDSSSKYLIGGKIYDYIRARKFVLSIGNTNGLNSQTVTEERIGVACANTFDDIYKMLIRMYSMWRDGRLTPAAVQVEKYSRECQNKHYIDIAQSCSNN